MDLDLPVVDLKGSRRRKDVNDKLCNAEEEEEDLQQEVESANCNETIVVFFIAPGERGWQMSFRGRSGFMWQKIFNILIMFV